MKRLGKIATVKFGKGGYQDAMFGLTVGFEFEGGDTCVDSSLCQYPPKEPAGDRFSAFTERMLRVVEIMEQAKVDEIYELVGIPVECEFDTDCRHSGEHPLVSWRVLTEVI